MGKGYNNNNHSIQHHHHFHHKSMFLPIFCRLSLKEVTLNNNINHNTNQTSNNDEPSSPKVSCMGQVKRNNRVIGFPTTSSAIVTTSNSNQQNHKYAKLKRFFSSKTLLPPAPNNVRGSRSCGTSKDTCERRFIRPAKNEETRVLVNVEEMDPPLPVVKNVAPPGEVNIWKRRFNGTKTNGLQIEQIRLPDCKVIDPHPPTV